MKDILRTKQGELDQVRREFLRGVRGRIYAQKANILDGEKRFSAESSTMKELYRLNFWCPGGRLRSVELVVGLGLDPLSSENCLTHNSRVVEIWMNSSASPSFK